MRKLFCSFVALLIALSFVLPINAVAAIDLEDETYEMDVAYLPPTDNPQLDVSRIASRLGKTALLKVENGQYVAYISIHAAESQFIPYLQKREGNKMNELPEVMIDSTRYVKFLIGNITDPVDLSVGVTLPTAHFDFPFRVQFENIQTRASFSEVPIMKDNEEEKPSIEEIQGIKLQYSILFAEAEGKEGINEPIAGFFEKTATLVYESNKPYVYFKIPNNASAVAFVVVAGKKLEEAKIDKVADSKYIKLPIENLTKVLPATLTLSPTNKSFHFRITFDSKSIKAISKVAVSEVSDKSTKVVGTTEAYAKITVINGNKKLGSAQANKNGKFSVTIKKQKAGTKLKVTATNIGNHSKSKNVKVVDKTAPAKPKVKKVVAGSKKVTGQAEANAKVFVYKGKTKLGSATVKKNGSFTVKIKGQKASTKLNVYVVDKAKNKSKTQVVTVKKK